MDSLEVLDKDMCRFTDDEKIRFRLNMHCNEDVERLSLRFMIHNSDQVVTATSVCSDFMSCKKGESYSRVFELDVSPLASGVYKVLPVLFELGELGEVIDCDGVYPGLVFEHEKTTRLDWKSKLYGDTTLEDMVCIE